MKPHKAEVGERYSDDSGWERFCSIDRRENRVTLDLGGGSISFTVAELEWVRDALLEVERATRPDKA